MNDQKGDEMNRTIETKKVVFLLWGVLILMSLSGCSTFQYVAGGIPFLHAKERYHPISGKDAALFSASIRQHPEDPNSLYRQACYDQERKKHHQAIERFNAVIAQDPDHVKAYNGLGISYDCLGMHARAADAYRKALEIDPNLDYVHNNLGYSFLLQEDPDSAIASFRNAIALNAKSRPFHNNLGLAYAKKGVFEPAFEQFELGGDAHKAHFNIGVAYRQQGQYDLATHHFSKALGLDAPSKATLDSTAQSSLKDPEPVVAGSSKTDTKEPEATPPIWPTEVRIEVSNGNGVNRMARAVGNYLKNRGINEAYLTNADHFGYRDTCIYYQEGFFREAYRIAQLIPGYQKIQMAQSLRRPEVKVRVLIGKDVIPLRDRFSKE